MRWHLVLATMLSFCLIIHTESEDLSYEVWKKKTEESWRQDNIKDLARQGDLLIREIDDSLEALKKNPESILYQRKALYSYNFLRELLNQQPAQSVSGIDLTWLAQQGYDFWKQILMKNWQEQNMTSDAEIFSLVGTVRITLMENKPEEISDRRLLYVYNIAREILDEPLATSISDFDHEWLDAVWSAYLPFNLPKRTKAEKLTKTTTGNKPLHAVKNWGLDQRITGAAIVILVLNIILEHLDGLPIVWIR